MPQLKTFSVGCWYCLHHCCRCSLVIFTICNQLMFPTSSDFTVSHGEISCRLHLVLGQRRAPCIHHSHSSLSGSSCHFGSVLCEWCLPSGATHAGEYILPGHWKENLTSDMLILAVISSSICGNKDRDWDDTLKCNEHYIWPLDTVMILKAMLKHFLPWHSCCWDSGERSWVQVCVGRPFHKQCPERTSPPVSGPPRSLTAGWVTNHNIYFDHITDWQWNCYCTKSDGNIMTNV